MKGALRGRIVTMNAAFDVIADGVLYIDGKTIVAAQNHAAPPPAGFADVKVVDTGATLFPGLIELHNHLAYNVLGLWTVPKKFANRDQWAALPSYHKNVGATMRVLATQPNLVPAITRYTECKVLAGGVTASQGLTLSSNAGMRKFFRGLVFNVEDTVDAELPNAKARIADVDTKGASAFLASLSKTCTLLHLSEGTDQHAHRAFEALATANPVAITSSLSGIHSVALTPADFKLLASKKASMVWSPLSNLLLYGETANVKAARDAGVTIGLGPDWTYSGSKNLLGELKVARSVSKLQKLGFSDRDLLAMATVNAAKILRWDAHVGSLEAGKRAFVVAIEGTKADAYATLFEATEENVRLVVIDGSARYGDAALMTKLGSAGETLKVAGKSRTVCLADDQPGAPAITLGDATAALTDAMKKLPLVAKAAFAPQREMLSAMALRNAPPRWSLALDELEDTGVDLRPHLEAAGMRTGPTVRDTPVHEEDVQSMRLDPLTFVDDARYIDTIAAQPNLPPELKDELYALYGRKPTKAARGTPTRAARRENSVTL